MNRSSGITARTGREASRCLLNTLVSMTCALLLDDHVYPLCWLQSFIMRSEPIAKHCRKASLGNGEISSSGVPLVLFHGPPGTGKTHAMRDIAAESGLKPFVLNTSKLQEDSYMGPGL